MVPLDFDDSLRCAAQRHPTKLALADSVQQLSWQALGKRLNHHALDELPRNPIGKVLKRELRDRLAGRVAHVQ